MKTNLVIVLLALSTPSVFSQKEITASDLKTFKTAIDAGAAQLKKRLEGNEDTKFSIEFSLDTFKIEEMMRQRIEFDYSTNGMIQTVYNAETEYDKLLNKYYKLLFNALEAPEKESLKQSQKNWLQFRDSERKLSAVLGQKDLYSGGGSMHREFIASHSLSLTQHRVTEIYDYLMRLDNFQK